MAKHPTRRGTGDQGHAAAHRLGRQMFKKLHVYASDEHHAAQKPRSWN
jgi:ribosomal protein L13